MSNILIFLNETHKMFFMFYLIPICLFLWFHSGRYYVKGMFYYALRNNLVVQRNNLSSEKTEGAPNHSNEENAPEQPYESSWKCVHDEIKEMKLAYLNFTNAYRQRTSGAVSIGLLFAFLEELFDVVHVFLKYGLVECMLRASHHKYSMDQDIHYLAPVLYFSFIIMFFLTLPTSLKLAGRYKKHQCIRNHRNLNNLNHLCEYIN